MTTREMYPTIQDTTMVKAISLRMGQTRPEDILSERRVAGDRTNCIRMAESLEVREEASKETETFLMRESSKTTMMANLAT